MIEMHWCDLLAQHFEKHPSINAMEPQLRQHPARQLLRPFTECIREGFADRVFGFFIAVDAQRAIQMLPGKSLTSSRPYK